jgi:hypothetical protein
VMCLFRLHFGFLYTSPGHPSQSTNRMQPSDGYIWSLRSMQRGRLGFPLANFSLCQSANPGIDDRRRDRE